MELTHSRLNVEAYQPNMESPPHDVIRREPGDIWLVSHQPILMDRPIQWSHHQKKDHVYIPLVPYLTQTDPELAMAFMLQLGCRVSFDVGKPIKRLHIVTGHPLHQVMHDDTNCWQVQIGLGLVLEK